ncbi:hypothetical protein C8R48DRAFT_780462 [Suillus tomentosus]|nr:hypothetical protein C8R48DRAFT_780462 [Suillus tomentosus]
MSRSPWLDALAQDSPVLPSRILVSSGLALCTISFDTTAATSLLSSLLSSKSSAWKSVLSSSTIPTTIPTHSYHCNVSFIWWMVVDEADVLFDLDFQ